MAISMMTRPTQAGAVPVLSRGTAARPFCSPKVVCARRSTIMRYREGEVSNAQLHVTLQSCHTACVALLRLQLRSTCC